MMEQKLKELKKKKTMEIDEFNEFNEEMEGHFIQNMSNLKGLSSIPSMKVSNGGRLLGIINQKQNRGLVVNMNSYQKVFIDYEDIEDIQNNKQKIVNDYEVGQYILYEVKGEQNGKMKGMVKNGDMDSLVVGQLINGVVLTQQDYGMEVKLGSINGFTKDKDKHYIENRVYLWQIVEIQDEVVYVTRHISRIQSNGLKVGSYYKGIILKQMEDGLLVKINRYVGFIRDEQQQKQQKQQQQSIECRVIMIDYVSKIIMMSNRESIVGMERQQIVSRRGEVLDGFRLIHQIKSGYMVESDGVRVLMRRKWMDDQTHNDLILSDSNVINRKVKLIEYDYLDGMWLGMAKQNDINKIESIMDI